MFAHYEKAFKSCRPYLLATSKVAPLLEWTPLGIDIRQDGLVINPQERGNEAFLRLLQQLDRMTFGPLGMAMPQWVFYDCGVMPSAVFGFAGDSESLEPWVRRALDLEPGYSGPVPMTIFIAIPMPTRGAWFTHTLCTLNQVCPGAAPAGMAVLSLALGVRVLKCDTLYGTTQWRSHRLKTYSRMGPLELVTAYTPSHSQRRTLTWRLQIERDNVEAALISPDGGAPAAPPATHMLDVDNEQALIDLQHELENRVPYSIVGPPITHGSIVQVPLRRGDTGE